MHVFVNIQTAGPESRKRNQTKNIAPQLNPATKKAKTYSLRMARNRAAIRNAN